MVHDLSGPSTIGLQSSLAGLSGQLPTGREREKKRYDAKEKHTKFLMLASSTIIWRITSLPYYTIVYPI